LDGGRERIVKWIPPGISPGSIKAVAVMKSNKPHRTSISPASIPVRTVPVRTVSRGRDRINPGFCRSVVHHPGGLLLRLAPCEIHRHLRHSHADLALGDERFFLRRKLLKSRAILVDPRLNRAAGGKK